MSLTSKALGHNVVKRIIVGSFWSLFGTATGKFFILLSGIVCARILGSIPYGQLGLIRSTIAMLIVVGSAGFGVTASKYIAEFRASAKLDEICAIAAVTRLSAIIFGAIISALAICFSAPIASAMLHAPELAFDLRCGALLLFFSIYNASQDGILAGFENFKAIGLNTLYTGIAEFAFIVAGAYYGGVAGAICGYGLSILMLTILNSRSIRTTLRNSGIPTATAKIKRRHIRLLWTFSLPAALCSIIVVATFWLLKTMLVRHCGFAQLGIYEAADQWKVIMLYIPSALSSILLPILSSHIGSGADTGRLLRYNMAVNIIIAILIATPIILFSSRIMAIYGEGFENPHPLIILAASTVFTTAALVTTTALTSMARVWLSLCFQILWSATLLISAHLLFSRGLGAEAAAWAILISYFVLAVSQMFVMKKSR